MKVLPVAFADLDLRVEEFDVLLDGREVSEDHLQLRLILCLVKNARGYNTSVDIH